MTMAVRRGSRQTRTWTCCLPELLDEPVDALIDGSNTLRPLSNNAFEQTAGSHSLAAAAHRERWADAPIPII